MQRGGIAQADDTSHTLACLLHSNGGGGAGAGRECSEGPKREQHPQTLLIYSTGNCWLNSNACVDSCMLNVFTESPPRGEGLQIFVVSEPELSFFGR